ncbi:methyl-accepting chemotaxis protein [Vibrio metschnikovii]|nr:methyl-accepting chemotaxis protein [Vibrio metschnikovii]SUP50451.1 methyl-accepting chemotaxis protein [Vibrio metschnikovii]
MVFHALNLIYQTGGVIASPQSFWISVLLVAFFLTAGHYIAWLWSILVIACCSIMIFNDLYGQMLPNFILNTSQNSLEVWSSLLVPLAILVIAQSYSSHKQNKH